MELTDWNPGHIKQGTDSEVIRRNAYSLAREE
jgi:hypothetical protein